MPKQMSRHAVGPAADIAPGACRIVDVDGKSIGVFNVNGEFRAALNYCPHEGAPVCRGRVSGTTLPSPPGQFEWGRDGEILACPWHGWEFDLTTGACLTDRKRLRMYEVTVEDGTVYVHA